MSASRSESATASAGKAVRGVAAGRESLWFSDVAILGYVAFATVIAHLLSNGRYGFHRDELATLDDALHLAWGYVAYPPITPFFARLSLDLFGTSLVGFRLFAALAQAMALFLTGLMAKELGASRGGQLVAVAAGMPFCLGGGAVMQYVSFDYLFWALTAYCVVRLCKSNDPKWCIAIGASVGLGMMAKYTMAFLALGIITGFIVTDARRYLGSKWLWAGVVLSLLVVLPNFLWQVQHHFISLDFLRDIHARDVRLGRTKNFLPDQLKLTLLAFPLAMAGLYFYLASPRGKAFRILGWMYVIPLLLFVMAKGRGYYLGACYPMLYAAGGAWGEQWIASVGQRPARTIRTMAWLAVAVNIMIAGAVTMRVAPVNSAWWRSANRLNDDLQEEVGWPDLVEIVAKIRDTLPARDRVKLGILAGNYGEAGAIDLYGGQYGLPRAISGVNSFWEHGYGNPAPETLIVVGISRGFLEENFGSCELAAHTWNHYGVVNEETRDHPDIFVCRGLKKSWVEFWKTFRYYG